MDDGAVVQTSFLISIAPDPDGIVSKAPVGIGTPQSQYWGPSITALPLVTSGCIRTVDPIIESRRVLGSSNALPTNMLQLTHTFPLESSKLGNLGDSSMLHSKDATGPIFKMNLPWTSDLQW